MRKQRMVIAFIVDDNLIGNKVAVKKLLRDIAAWQAAEGYPFTFTETSLNLSEDDQPDAVDGPANSQTVFIGIESPNEESLRERKNFQNVCKGGTIADRVRKMQDSGLDVWCGMIVGFDHDDAGFSRRSTSSCVRPTSCTRWWACSRPSRRRRRVARWLHRPDARDLYEIDFYFERLKNLYSQEISILGERATPTGDSIVGRNESKVARCSASRGPVPTPHAQRSRTGAAPHLSPSNDEHAPAPPGCQHAVHLRDQVGDAYHH